MPDHKNDDKKLQPEAAKLAWPEPFVREQDFNARNPVDDGHTRTGAEFRPLTVVDLSVGPYRIMHRLQNGSLASVYAALPSSIHRQLITRGALPSAMQKTEIEKIEGCVAIKVDHSRHMRLLAREAQLLARIKHPHVMQFFHPVRLLHCPSQQAFFSFVVMPLFHMDLHTLLTSLEKPMRHNKAARLMLQAHSGLAALHEGGIVHGDIKSENMLINVDDRYACGWRLCLTDLGSAYDTKADPATMAFMGRGGHTLNFSAPEVILNPTLVGPGIDVFSLACTYVECVALRPLFRPLLHVYEKYHLQEVQVLCGGASFPPELCKHYSGHVDIEGYVRGRWMVGPSLAYVKARTRCWTQVLGLTELHPVDVLFLEKACCMDPGKRATMQQVQDFFKLRCNE